jgi:cytochrome P450/NADPH-cytochrome P450 reductase
MFDIASQLVLKWARKGPEYQIPVAKDFTRLTLDTIALCAMDYRFNSFYQDEMHPFVNAMTNVLKSRSEAGQLSGMINRMMPSYNAQIAKDAEFQRQVSKELVQHRRENPSEKKDLLNAMIYGKDPKTGKTMRDELIAANMQTFLVAGTSSTSSRMDFILQMQVMKRHRGFYHSHFSICSRTRRHTSQPKQRLTVSSERKRSL